MLIVYVQLAIGGRGHMTQHMSEGVQCNIKTKTTIWKARQIQSGLNHGVLHTAKLLLMFRIGKHP